MNNLYFDPFSLRRRMIFSFLTHFPRATLDWMIGKLFKCHGALINHERKRCSGILNRTNRQIFCHSDMKLHLEDFQRGGKTSDRESFLALTRIFNSNFLVHFPSVVGKSYQRDKLRGNEVTRCSIKISMRHHHPVTFSIVILPNCKTSSDGFKASFFAFLLFSRKSFAVNWLAMFRFHKFVLILTSI